MPDLKVKSRKRRVRELVSMEMVKIRKKRLKQSMTKRLPRKALKRRRKSVHVNHSTMLVKKLSNSP